MFEISLLISKNSHPTVNSLKNRIIRWIDKDIPWRTGIFIEKLIQDKHHKLEYIWATSGIVELVLDVNNQLHFYYWTTKNTIEF